MTRDDLEVALAKVFPDRCFSDMKFRPTLLGQMPDYDLYLQNKADLPAERKRHGDMTEALKACYEEPLLTREQELHCLRRYNFYKWLARKELKRGHVAKAEEFLKKAAPDKTQIVCSNLRLCVDYASKLTKRSQDFEDILQNGNFLIVRAVDLFDWRMGNKFCTYATWCLIKTLWYMTTIYYRFETKHHQFIPIGGPDSGDSLEFEDAIPSRQDRASNKMDASEAEFVANMFLRQTSEREAKILRGLIMEDRTLDAVAKEVNVSRERVRQLRDDGVRRIVRFAREANIKVPV